MAVPKSQRAKTPLTVLTELDALISYTIQLCTDERRFPKRYRWCLTKDIIDSAIKAKADAARANPVYVNDRESAILRRTYQQKAIANLAALVKLGKIPKETPDHSLESWASHAAHGNNHRIICKMKTYYKSLWRD